MSELQIELPDGRSHFDPGEIVELGLGWELDRPPEAIELRFVWNTAGKGTTDVTVVRSVSLEAPLVQESRRTSVTLPRSPYSFSGTLISLIWAIELVALPDESSTRQEITIAPGGREVRLQKVQDSTGEDDLFE